LFAGSSSILLLQKLILLHQVSQLGLEVNELIDRLLVLVRYAQAR